MFGIHKDAMASNQLSMIVDDRSPIQRSLICTGHRWFETSSATGTYVAGMDSASFSTFLGAKTQAVNVSFADSIDKSYQVVPGTRRGGSFEGIYIGTSLLIGILGELESSESK